MRRDRTWQSDIDFFFFFWTFFGFLFGFLFFISGYFLDRVTSIAGSVWNLAFGIGFGQRNDYLLMRPAYSGLNSLIVTT